MSPIGNPNAWYRDAQGRWVHDPSIEPPSQEPAAPRPRRTFTHDDGSTYARVPAGEFATYDDFDSTLVVDPGAPD